MKLDLIKKYLKECLIGLFLFIILILGTVLFLCSKVFLKSNKPATEIVLEEEIKQEKTVYVDVKGEVVKPGVYELKEGSVVLDAIKKAGGVKETADTSYINLSKRIKDEMVVIIYSKEEILKMKQGLESVVVVEGECKCPEVINDGCIGKDNIVTNKDSKSTRQAEKVNINTASKEELQFLKGIGEKKAQDIITYRKEHGAFKSLEELKEIKGIGASIYEKIKDSLTL